MRAQKQPEDGSPQDLEAAVNSLPIVASARTGLAGKGEAVVNRLPVDYEGRTVRDAIEYLTSATDIADDKVAHAESVKRELGARGSVVVVNGKKANLTDNLGDYLVEREHQLPGGTTKKYRELEIEVSAVQQGGYLATFSRNYH